MSIVFALLLALMLSINSVGQQPLPAVSGGFSSLQLVAERPYHMVLASGANLGDPNAARFVPRNATVDGRTADLSRDILEVAELRDRSQVSAPAIQPDAVHVVALAGISRTESQERAVQQDATAFSFDPLFPHGVSVFIQVPPPLTSPLGVSSVNNNVSTHDAAACQERDQCSQAIVSDDWCGRLPLRAPGVLAAGGAVVPLPDLAWGLRDSNTTSGAGHDDGSSWAERAISLPNGVAAHRAEPGFTGIHGADGSEEVVSALFADARDGTLWLHLDSPPGVALRAVDAAPEHLRASILPRMGARP